MNRSDFQNLAEIRLADAEALLKRKCYSGAYYVCGYAVECALKACIAKRTRRYDFPPDPNTIREMYVHDLKMLVKAAGLGPTLDNDLKRDRRLNSYWATVKDWSEKSRYEQQPEKKARDLHAAITDKKHGVLRWISQHW